MNKIKKGLYEHFKGKRYEVLGVAVHSETLEQLVAYRSLYKGNFPKGTIWVRPMAMFKEKVSVNGKLVQRFRLITA